MGNPTVGAIKTMSDNLAGHLRVELVAGVASAAGNGSVAISGLSAASDAPLGCFVIAGTAANNTNISLGSVTFTAARMQIANTTTTNKSVVLFWWDRA